MTLVSDNAKAFIVRLALFAVMICLVAAIIVFVGGCCQEPPTLIQIQGDDTVVWDEDTQDIDGESHDGNVSGDDSTSTGG